MVRDAFIEVVSTYEKNHQVVTDLWAEVVAHYCERGRCYHTLDHLENMLPQLLSVKYLIADWEAVICALAYHDVIYNATAKDNEEKSADLARTRLGSINMPTEKVSKCATLILATKSHEINTDEDTNLFTDADLAILGADWPTYHQYILNIRAEYSIYPDLLYKPGRKKVLKHFLNMEHIFKTEVFRERFEAQARENLRKEIDSL